MTAAEAEAFLAACHQRLSCTREQAEVALDGERWIVGFVQGAPCKSSIAEHNSAERSRFDG